MSAKKSSKSEDYRRLSIATTIPVIMVVAPLVGYFVGRFLDGWLGTSPYLSILFLILGFVAAGKEIYNMIKRISD